MIFTQGCYSICTIMPLILFLLEWGECQQCPHWRVVYSASPGEGFSSSTNLSWFNDLDSTGIACVCLSTYMCVSACAHVSVGIYMCVYMWESWSPEGMLSTVITQSNGSLLTVPAQWLGVSHLKTHCHCNPFSKAIVILKMTQSGLRCSLVSQSGMYWQLPSTHFFSIIAILCHVKSSFVT